MIPKEAIEKAIEGGWQTLPNWKYAQDGLYWGDGIDFIHHCVIALDPSFWQGLGKALGWIEICDNPDHGFIEAMSFHEIGRLGCPGCGHDDDHIVPSSRDNWKRYARRFYDLILTGGDTEAFWKELLGK